MKLNLGFPLLIASALIINGCAFSKDDKSKKDQNPVTIQQVPQPKELGDSILETHMGLRYSPRPQLHEYDVIVSWPANQRAKIMLDGLGQKISAEGVQTSSAVFVCKKSETFKIRVRTFAYGAEAPNEFEKDGKCPTDTDLSGDILNPFPETLVQLGRLVLRDRAELNLDGKSLDLEVDQLLIDGTAEIRSYQSGEASKENLDTSKVPTISIKAKKAGPYGNAQAGQIEFHLIGLNGKDGRHGKDLEKDHNDFREKRKLNRDGSNGSHGKLSTAKSGDSISIKCQQPPTPGKPGLDGEDGLPGENGQQGMDTPKLILKIDQHENFVVNIFQKPGKGGRGGTGGPGISGGHGGSPGHNNDGICPAASAGKKGVDGATGANGQDGRNGADTDPDVSPNIKPFIR